MTGYNEAINYNFPVNYNGGITTDTHDGFPKKHKRIYAPVYGKTKPTFGNVQYVYDKAKALPRKETKELRDAISEFVEPQIARQAVLPDIKRIDYAALEASAAAYEKFLKAIDNIQSNIVQIEEMRQEDEELFQLAVIACAIQ